MTITPLDSARTRIYLAPYGLWLTLDAGTFDTLELSPKTGVLRVGFSPNDQFTPEARLRIEQPAKISSIGKFHPATPLKVERDAYIIPLNKKVTWLELSAQKRYALRYCGRTVMDARWPVARSQYSIHCLAIPVVRSINSSLGLRPCSTISTTPVLNFLCE